MILTQRPPLLDEVISKRDHVVYATVNVPATINDGEEYFIGKVLTTSDGGKTFDALSEELWAAGSFALDAIVYHSGHIWKSLADANTAEPGTDVLKWEDQGIWNANGILIENIDTTGTYAVLVTGKAIESYLRGYDAGMLQALFDNKIFIQ